MQANQRSQDIHKNISAVADNDAAHAGIIATITAKYREPLDAGCNNIHRQHEQRLPHAVPVVKLASAAVEPEFRIFIGKGPAAPMSRMNEQSADDASCQPNRAHPIGQQSRSEQLPGRAETVDYEALT
jgi:hypothetical protein